MRKAELGIPIDTTVEIIATKNEKHYKTVMTIKEWLNKPINKSFKYQMYQLGFSQFKIENNGPERP